MTREDIKPQTQVYIRQKANHTPKNKPTVKHKRAGRLKQYCIGKNAVWC